MYIPGLFDKAGERKLFFFYSMEAPQVQKPGQVRLYRMPTGLERAGNFSQTFDVNGRLTDLPLALAAATTSSRMARRSAVISSRPRMPQDSFTVSFELLSAAVGDVRVVIAPANFSRAY